jgi:hypothetical protein
MMTDVPFWKEKPLEDMSREEWESLCDGCGICCLEKVEGQNKGEIRLIGVSCEYLDLDSCRCLVYEIRTIANPRCTTLTPQNIREISWLPPTCAYRTLVEGRDLAWWHPLVSGNPNTVYEAGVSVRDQAVSGAFVHSTDTE